MEKKKLQFYTATLFLLFFLAGCNVTKHLKNNETLYTGGSVKINNNGKVPEKKTLRQELEELLPEPNTSVFGMRPKLWIYYNVDPGDKKKGLKAWARRKLAEPPVLIEDINTENIEQRMLNVLTNKGYFQAGVESAEVGEGKKVDLKFTASVKTPYRIRNLIYPEPTTQVDSQILVFKEKTLLRENDVFSLDKLKEERDRIDAGLKELGYFYFNPDFIVFEIDSTVGDRKINVHMAIKEETPDKGLKAYTINRISMNPDYEIADTVDRSEYNRIRVDSISYLKKGNGMFRPRALTRLVFLKEDSLYSRKNHNITLNRLMGLDVFKYVNIRFAEVDSSKGENQLNSRIQMSPLMKKSLRAEVQGYTKSTNFAGPAIQISFRNRNAFRGAELLILNLNTGFETQFTGRYKGYYSYEVQPGVQLLLPRFLLPFGITNRNSMFVPRTKIELNYRLQHIIERYEQNSFNFMFGYQWKETIAKEHEFNPINISYINFPEKQFGAEFREQLDSIPALAVNFENQVILGSIYNFTYNNLLENAGKGRHHYYFNGNADISGNLMGLLQNLFNEGDGEVGGVRFKQYVRGEVDFRYYHDFSKSERLATRLNFGVGYPYANPSDDSEDITPSLPFAKQFYAGGPSGIRAFRARTVGPGTFRDPNDESAFFTQLGDIKLEGNIEYRFDLISVLKGAVFLDAGNTWLTRPRRLTFAEEDTVSKVGVFDSKRFLREIVVGTGVGLRVDVSFLILRLDVAFPIRKLWFYDKKLSDFVLRDGSDRWAFDDLHFGDPEWRKRNLVFNIAIGYPF